MRNLEENLRDAVLDLADGAPLPHELAAVARTRGRRIRRRRHVAFAAVAIALAGITATPYTVLRRDAVPPPPATNTSPSPSAEQSVEPSLPARALPALDAGTPYKLLGGAVITALSRTEHKRDGQGALTEGETHHVLLDREAGSYQELPGKYRSVVPGPAGEFAAYGNESAERTTRVVTARGKVRYTSYYEPVGSEPQWSPDGSRLLIPTLKGYVINDMLRGDNPKEGSLSNCPDYCSLSWLPDGKEFAVPQRDSTFPRTEARPDTVGSLDIYSAGTGKLVRTLQMTGRPIGTRGWSPDGKSVLARDEGGTIVLTRVADGSPIADLIGSDALYLADGRILTTDDEFVMLYDARGRLLEQADLPREFQGLTVTAGLS